MDSNTMQLAVVTPDRLTNEIGEVEHRRRNWLGLTTREEKKHRIHDYVVRLERENARLLQVAATRDREMKAADDRVSELEREVEELREKLHLATEANKANAHPVDFHFHDRPIASPEDQATMPVTQVQLFTEDARTQARVVSATAAFLNRVVPKPAEVVNVEFTEEPETKLLTVVPPVTRVTPLLVESDDEDDEDETSDGDLYNDTARGWNARPSASSAVTWGNRTLHADMSSTGTFLVTPLHRRGTGPTALPDLS